MSIGLIVFLSVVVLYLTMVVIVGAALTARVKRDLNLTGDYWRDDHSFGVGAGAILWVFGLMYLGWLALSDRLLVAGLTKKCILCGTTNESDSAHCKH